MALPNKLSSFMISKVFKPATIANGLPPNVEPCLPGEIRLEAFSLAIHAPMGIPEAKPLASVTTSGFILLF